MLKLKEIAKMASVDISTVSRALNDSPRVKKETKDRIKSIAEKHNYVPNNLASGLAKNRTQTIGVLVPEFINTFYAEIIEGMENVFSKRGYSLIFGKSNFRHDDEIRIINMFFAKRVDGIILCTVSKKTVEYLEQKRVGIPLMLVDPYEQSDAYDSVSIDNNYGVSCIVDHCFNLGHRSFGFIGDKIVTSKRLEAYKQSLNKYNINLSDEHICIGQERYEAGGYQRMKDILSKKNIPTTIFAETDNLAIGAMRAAKISSYIIPRDISIVGFDDIVASSYTEIPLTTIYQPKEKMGQIAAKRLIDRVEKRIDESVKKIILQPKLIIRASTGRPTR